MKVEAPRGEPVLVMEREFDAPRDLVWDALTDPAQVAQWYGGHGFENPVCEMDVRKGGRWTHVMRTPDGADHPLEFEFLEVKPPERLVWRSAGPAAAAGGPHSNTMTVTLTAVGARTRWRLVVTFGSEADRKAAQGMGFTEVLGQGCDRLEAVARRRGVLA